MAQSIWSQRASRHSLAAAAQEEMRHETSRDASLLVEALKRLWITISLSDLWAFVPKDSYQSQSKVYVKVKIVLGPSKLGVSSYGRLWFYSRPSTQVNKINLNEKDQTLKTCFSNKITSVALKMDT